MSCKTKRIIQLNNLEDNPCIKTNIVNIDSELKNLKNTK